MTSLANKPDSKVRNFALFDIAFRPLFLGGSIFSLVAILIWAGLFSGHLSLNVFGGGLWWHTHEMLFGFVCAIIMGFLLTAVQNWTSKKSINHLPLLALVLLWLSARLALLFPSTLPSWLISILDISFLPIAAFFFIRPIIKVKLWRNLIFLPLLIALTFANAAMHYSVHADDLSIILPASKTAVLLVAMIMSIMGGRVMPMFTANGTGTQRVHELKWLEKSALGSLLLVIIFNSGLINLPHIINALLLFAAAIFHYIRVIRWRFWVTLRTPLVWSLHLSYSFIPTGLLLFGINQVSDVISTSQAIHAITVGAMGMMILSMISRVSLGHTGRPIKVGRIMTWAFMILFFAALVRIFGQVFTDDYIFVIQGSALLWAIAYLCFVILYAPILIKKRINN
jgi:uncharacterized protein involved in response to NO